MRDDGFDDQYSDKYDEPRADTTGASFGGDSGSESGTKNVPAGTPAELAALFAVALEDEPPSTVTAESVLRAVRAARTGGSASRRAEGVASRAVGAPRIFSAEWFAEHASAWKWGGGLVAVAAAVGAVVVIGPSLSGMTSTSADSAALAGGSAQSASAERDTASLADARAIPETASAYSWDSAADGDDTGAAADSAADAAAAEESAGDASADTMSGLAAEDGEAAGDAMTSPTHPPEQTATPGAGDSAGGGDLSSGPQLCPMEELTGSEVAAARTVLGSAVSRTGDLGGFCADRSERGTSFLLTTPHAEIAVKLSPGDADTSLSIGEFAVQQPNDGGLTVTGRSATAVVTVAANGAAAQAVDVGALTDIARAVLAAAR